jgi:cellulose 1,4-beta-cellobiosidase
MPTQLTASAGNAQVSLSWNASTGAGSYDVKRATQSGGPYTTIATLVLNTTYTDSSVTNGTMYYYVVSAVNSAGTSANSNQAAAMPLLPYVVPPSNVTGMSTTYNRVPAILLQWSRSASPNITQYNVYRSTGSSAPNLYGYVYGAQMTGVYDLGVKHGTKYNYEVTVVNSGRVESKPSNEVTVNF